MPDSLVSGAHGSDRWQWVAHEPGTAPSPPGRRGAAPPVPRAHLAPGYSDSTPAYRQTPRWGLPWGVLAPAGQPRERSERVVTRFLAGQSHLILAWTFWALVVAAVAYVARYAALAYYARSLTPGWVEMTTTVAVWSSGAFAFGLGVFAAVCAVAWVVERRVAVCAPHSDPRRPVTVWTLGLVPVLNLVGAPLLLRELIALWGWRRDLPDDADGPGAAGGGGRAGEPGVPGRPVEALAPSGDARTWINRWWLAWVVNWGLLAVVLWRSTAEGPQAAADVVILSAVVCAAAAVTAWLTRRVMKCFDGPSQSFTRRFLPARIVD